MPQNSLQFSGQSLKGLSTPLQYFEILIVNKNSATLLTCNFTHKSNSLKILKSGSEGTVAYLGEQWRHYLIGQETGSPSRPGFASHDAGCYVCNKGAPTDLRDYPDVLMEFDHEKNESVDPYALPVGKEVAWRCSADPTHEGWVSGFYRTSKQERCPSCTNKRGSKHNNLKITHPQVTEGSGHRVYWKCNKSPDHEWQAKINDRTRDMTRCPFCIFRKTSVTNVLTTLAPKIAKEWHPRKNGKAQPDNERARSRTLRWWLCSKCSHEWTAEPYRRYLHESGCPRCSTERQVKHMLKVRGIKKSKVDMSAFT